MGGNNVTKKCDLKNIWGIFKMHYLLHQRSIK